MKPVTAARTIAAVPIATVVALAGCHSGTSASPGSGAGSAASALATSTAVATAEADAKALVQHCLPQSAAGQIRLISSAAAREGVLACAGVPRDKRGPAEACALSNVEKNHATRPKGLPATAGWLLAQFFPCAQQYQGTAAAPPASAGKK